MLSYLIFRILIEIFRFIPFCIIHFLSDIIAYFNFYIIGYRKKIIKNNLNRAFPLSNAKTINRYTLQFYKNLMDIFFESLKCYTAKQDQIAKRFEITNLEVIEELYKQKKNIIFANGHSGNWELATLAAPYYIKHKINVLYKPLTNKRIDNFILKHRQRNKANLIPISETTKAFQSSEQPYCVVMLADQRPLPANKGIETIFLGQKTFFQPGVEILAKKYDTVVIFWWMKRTRRGYYQTTAIPYTFTPKNTQREEITRAYVKFIEEQIQNDPPNWLWSHNRWKYL